MDSDMHQNDKEKNIIIFHSFFFSCPDYRFPYKLIMLGNEAAKRTLSTFFDAIASTGEVRFPFLVMQGDEGTGVLSYLLDEVNKVLGGYAQDLLLLRDLSGEGDIKRHTLKVDVKKEEQLVMSDTYGPVSNVGARDISHRLSLAPAGSIKIVVIENIHRMTVSAANALLKSFEEPLPGRLIIGTTTNASRLLDTIVSRALVIKTVAPELQDFLSTHYTQEKNTVPLERAIALVGYEKDEIETLISDEKCMTTFAALEDEIFGDGAGFRIAAHAKDLSKTRTTQQLIHAILVRADHKQRNDIIERLFVAKRMVGSNVNADHIWFSLGVDK